MPDLPALNMFSSMISLRMKGQACYVLLRSQWVRGRGFSQRSTHLFFRLCINHDPKAEEIEWRLSSGRFSRSPKIPFRRYPGFKALFVRLLWGQSWGPTVVPTSLLHSLILWLMLNFHWYFVMGDFNMPSYAGKRSNLWILRHHDNH